MKKATCYVLLLAVLVTFSITGCEPQDAVPSYLEAYSELFREDPRAANMKWFREAGYGMFIHYGLYSQLGRGEWVQLREKIPVAEYARLKDSFSAEHFDPEFICDLALRAGMKYITITSKHHDGFCLFQTEQTDFNALKSPARISF